MIAVLLLAAGAIVQTTRASDDDRTQKLYGSCYVAVRPQATAPFLGLLTFDAGGGLVADAPPSPLDSAAHGNWAPRDHGEVAYTFVGLSADTQRQIVGTVKVDGTLQYDAGQDSWSGPFKTYFLDVSGKVIGTDAGTVRLTRIVVGSLH